MSSDQSTFQMSAIAYVQTPFKDKFGIPRQPGLAVQAQGVIKFNKNPDLKTALKTIDQFSHLWIVFVFHEHGGKNWKPSIRPPRLGGAQKVGVLASRSPHRPNAIGMSAVSIASVNLEAAGGPEIVVNGVDLLDGTPVLDIKPYIPYADSIPDANAGWASEEIPRYPVSFDVIVADESLKKLIVEIIELDPRPAYKKRKSPAADPATWGSQYGLEIQGYDVKYEIQESGFIVKELIKM